MNTITHVTTFGTESCYSCGVLFAMPADLQNKFRNFGGTFYCPNGHGQVYSKSRLKNLEEQLEAKERELREAKCETLRKQQQVEFERLGREAAEKKLRRVKNGVCPCCQRSFQNLGRHMKTKHPEAVTAK